MIDWLESEIRLFGSCVTGLALPDSDIDIGILGFELYPRSSLIVLINPLLEALKAMPWVVSMKPIFSCAVPLIKLEVDPTVADQFGLFNLSEKQHEEIKHEEYCKQ